LLLHGVEADIEELASVQVAGGDLGRAAASTAE